MSALRDRIRDRDVVELITADRVAAKISTWLKWFLGLASAGAALLAFCGFATQWDVKKTADEMKERAEKTLAAADLAVRDAKEKADKAVSDTRTDTTTLTDQARAEVNHIAAITNEARQKLAEFKKLGDELDELKKRVEKLPSTLMIGTYTNHLIKSSEWSVDFDFEVKFAFVVPVGFFENIDWIHAIDPDTDITISRHSNGKVTSTVRYKVDKVPQRPPDVRVRIVAFGFGSEGVSRDPNPREAL